MQKKKAWSKKPEAFPTLDSTQIPQLQNFAKQCTLARRERIASDLITQLGLMYVDIKASAESKNETHGLSEDQRVELLSLLIQKFKMHELVCNRPFSLKLLLANILQGDPTTSE